MLGLGIRLYYLAIVSDERLLGLEILGLALFAPLFAWISFSFVVAATGFAIVMGRFFRRRSREAGPLPVLNSSTTSARTAILMPVYNESPTTVFAGIEAMMRSLISIGCCEHFDFFVLSDSTNPDVQKYEYRLWQTVVEDFDDRHPQLPMKLHYRHRPKNIARKSGNIADFCENWGEYYQFMIVLDADSLLDGQTIVGLHQRMLADKKLGILQVIPVPIGRNSLFARIQQFSADVYGPIYVAGFSAWSGGQGNYFGHNAILRVQAFKQHCALPRLSGPEPLGGDILSHDFVEAALMLRAGFEVRIATELGGSYEECPPTISDYAKRDQRWCQGNLQHARLIVSEGFQAVSRFHFFTGVMAYCSAPLWIAFLAVTITAHAGANPVTTPAHQTSWALWLFALSMFLLLAPKFWGAATTITESKLTGAPRSVFGIVSSVIFEIFCSILLAPIMALLHTRFVLGVLSGKSVQWKTQTRDERGVEWSEAIREYKMMPVIGIVAAIVLAVMSTELLIWFLPFLLGLVLAIPIVVAAGSRPIGDHLRSLGLLLTAAEISPPPIETTRDRLAERIEARRLRGADDVQLDGPKEILS